MICSVSRVIIAMVMIVSSVSFGAAYGGGTGTTGDPYQIASKTDLLALAANTADYDKCFILTADIDLDPNLPGGQIFTKAIIAPDTSSAYDFQGTAFTGTFNGNGHKITYLIINGGSNEYLGLFGYISTNGIIKNLGVENCSISGYNSGAIGGLVGDTCNGSVSNCYSTGSVSGSNSFFIGGLIGSSYNNSISDCYSTCVVSSSGETQYYIGGLVGSSNNGKISNCYSTGIVCGSSGSYCIGGLVGYNYGAGSISHCHSASGVSGYCNVGGLVGDSDDISEINYCYSVGAVSGFCEVGGLVGYNYYGIISNCYSTSAVGGSSGVGGLIGSNNGIISECYSTGSVSGSTNSNCVGGLVGNNAGLVYDSFWNTETSGQTTSAGGIGKTTSEMKTLLTFTSTSLPTSWDFTTIWAICEGTNYPRLQWQIPAGDWVCPDGVSVEDLSYFVQRWLESNCASSNNCGGVDMNTSGTVDFQDFAILAANWLE